MIFSLSIIDGILIIDLFYYFGDYLILILAILYGLLSIFVMVLIFIMPSGGSIINAPDFLRLGNNN